MHLLGDSEGERASGNRASFWSWRTDIQEHWKKSDKEFNVTRERIRQIEAKALRKLRNPVRSKRIRDFLA